MAPKRKVAARGKAGDGPVIELTGTEAIQLKSALDAGQKLGDDILLHLLGADKQCEGLYSKTCKSKSNNPNCLCNIIPSPDSYRRTGLWAKNANVTVGLGPDPSLRHRQDLSIPAGLRNLGNTCYVNSVLQFLFAIKAFRDAIYAVEAPILDDPVVSALRQLFLELEHGPVSPVDPAPLAKALQLDNAVQQDGQEFMKLLLNLLEHRFTVQPSLSHCIQSLLRGQSGYETLCLTCNTPSDSSARSENFYELDIPVRGFHSLQESLASLLTPEILEGDNQFACTTCHTKRDAKRSLQIRSLPPFLCLSLQRFVYDFHRGDRVKAVDKFSFPVELKGSDLVGEHGPGCDSIYDLEAILIHKGGSAMQGHYVAHIKMDADADGQGATWWRFDDEAVTKLPNGPFRTTDHGGGGGTAASAAAHAAKASKDSNEGKAKKSDKKGKRTTARKSLKKKKADIKSKGDTVKYNDLGEVDVDSGLEIIDATTEVAFTENKVRRNENKSNSSTPNQQLQPHHKQTSIVSGNAYLLVYHRRGIDPIPYIEQNPDVPPAWLADARSKLLEAYTKECEAYAEAKKEAESAQAARRAHVRELLEAAANGMPDNDIGCFISTEWLQSWADAPASHPPPPIDNSSLLCKHRALDPSRTGSMKRIPTHIWLSLVTSCKGGPELKPTDACKVCLGEVLKSIAMAEGADDARDRFVAIAGSLLSSDGNTNTRENNNTSAYYVSRAWLSSWHRRGGRNMMTTSPTAALRCPHGGLLPEPMQTLNPKKPYSGHKGRVAAPRRIAIPADFWQFLRHIWEHSETERLRKFRFKEVGKNNQKKRNNNNNSGNGTGGGVIVPENDVKQEEGKGTSGCTEYGDVVVAVEISDDDDDAVVTVDDETYANERDGGEKSSTQQQTPVSTAHTTRTDVFNNNNNDNKKIVLLEEYPLASSTDCLLCRAHMDDAAVVTEQLQSRLATERACLSHLLAPGAMFSLVPECSYNLVPHGFMDHWRTYMSQTSSSLRHAVTTNTAIGVSGGGGGAATAADVIVQAPSLNEYMSRSMCTCCSPPLLAFNPPQVVNRRGKWVVVDSSHDDRLAPPFSFEVVTTDDWEALKQHYMDQGEVEEGDEIEDTGFKQSVSTILATLKVENETPIEPNTMPHTTAPAAEESADETFGQDVNALYERKVGTGRNARANTAGKAWLETQPAVCLATLDAHREAIKFKKLSYIEAEVMVETCATNEEAVVATIESTLGADARPGTTAPAAVQSSKERKSKRARKGRSPVTIDCTTNLWDFRLRVYQALNVHPRNARVFVRGRCITDEMDDTTTMAQCEIYPGEEIRIVDTGEHDPDDLSGIFFSTSPNSKKSRQGGPEGFGGTALTGLYGNNNDNNGSNDHEMITTE